MEAQFLQNFQVGGQPLTQEIIDAILAENNRDVDAAKAPFADYDSLKDQLKTAKDGLKAFEGVDVAQLQGQITKLQGDLDKKDQEHQAQLADLAFDRALENAITGAKGRNVKGIRANLDLDALKASKNQEADIKAALDGLKKRDSYLFDTGDVPPPYSAGTGTGGGGAGTNNFNFGFTGVRARETGK